VSFAFVCFHKYVLAKCILEVAVFDVHTVSVSVSMSVSMSIVNLYSAIHAASLLHRVHWYLAKSAVFVNSRVYYIVVHKKVPLLFLL